MFLLIVAALLFCLCAYVFPASKIDCRGRTVLVSGCDTGVGRACAIALDQQGFHVFAGVFNGVNIPSLRDELSHRATVFRLDITNEDEIDAAYHLVEKTAGCLHGLVNNAGIITHGPIDWTSLSAMHQLMDVNFFGHVAMIKRFIPLLIRQRNSRVVNVVSAAGLFSFPNTSAYSASKYAMRSFSDCLRREMSPFRLHVSSIEPGALRTPMMSNFAQMWRDLWNQLSSDVQQRWGIDYLNGIVTKSISSPFMIYADHPSTVVRSIEHALSSTRPQISYRPGWQAKVIVYFLYLLPTYLSDMLISQVFHFVPSGVQHQLTH